MVPRRRCVSITVRLWRLFHPLDGGINRYYYDMTKEVGYAIVPVITYETCFNILKDDLAFNSILPDLEGFVLQEKTEVVREHTCRVWYHEEKNGDKLNKYWYYEWVVELGTDR